MSLSIRPATISNPTIWGKVPSCSDFIRHNLKHHHSAALQAWIAQYLPEMEIVKEPEEKTETPSRHTPSKNLRRRAQEAKWMHLSPVDLVEPRAVKPTAPVAATPKVAKHQSVAGHAGLPWCFVLPPGSLPFAMHDYVIGVWMTSYDKVGRIYPLVMLQTASPPWVEQYFQQHSKQPCDWLFAAARAMAHLVLHEEARKGADGLSLSSTEDQPTALVQRLEQLWVIYQPSWNGVFGRVKNLPDKERISHLITSPHATDPIRSLHGVRYLPWADWPERLHGSKKSPTPQAAFWQQDVRGRFVGAAVRMQDVV